MEMQVKSYYDKIAGEYDQSRFANSYGHFIHAQEWAILKRYLQKEKIDKNLDLACGTGRFLDFATHGADISEEMLKLAKEKFPTVNFSHCAAADMPFEDDFFDNVLSFHLMMHLDMEQLQEILDEVHRVIRKGGLFIFDIPSAKRRELTNYVAKTWHGGNQTRVADLKKRLSDRWELVAYQGISFFPIHRIPSSIRKYFIPLDTYLSRSWVKEYSSHLVFVLRAC